MSVKATDSQIVIYASADVESSAIEVAGIVLDDDMPEVGGAVPFMRASLEDGTDRVLVLFAIAPDEVAEMASDQAKRAAIVDAIETAANAL